MLHAEHWGQLRMLHGARCLQIVAAKAAYHIGADGIGQNARHAHIAELGHGSVWVGRREQHVLALQISMAHLQVQQVSITLGLFASSILVIMQPPQFHRHSCTLRAQLAMQHQVAVSVPEA